jgi:hypothetical protein
VYGVSAHAASPKAAVATQMLVQFLKFMLISLKFA